MNGVRVPCFGMGRLVIHGQRWGGRVNIGGGGEGVDLKSGQMVACSIHRGTRING